MRAATKALDPGANNKPEITPVAPGLYALGSAIPIDGRISWHPKGAKGYQATRCYLLEEQGSYLLIDPGLRIQEDLVISQLEPFLGKGKSVSVFLTRSEPDCFGCLEKINARFELEKVLTGGGHNPFDGFEDISGAGSGTRGDVVAIAREGKIAPITLGTDRQLHVLHASLRLNSTFWIYDSGTKTLFASDSFSHSIGTSIDDAMQLDTTCDFTMEHVREHLLAKFWWMTNADTRSLSSGLKNLFETREIKNICSSHGRPFVGEVAVQRAYNLVQEALAVSLDNHAKLEAKLKAKS
jgi:flavorubredoxin